MTEQQILSAIQEVLLTARISNVSGTDAEWTAANPILNNGEVGFVKGSNPLKFKVGDGVTAWKSLGWANITTLAQLDGDATHRIVTDEQIASWNVKVSVTDNLTSDSPTAALSARQGNVLKTAIDNKAVSEYSLSKVTTEAGFASTYRLTKDGEPVGIPLNIPLDQVLKSSLIKTVTTGGVPYTDAKVGDKYIEFLFQNNTTPQYLPVQDLVDIYTADGTYIEVSPTNVISLKYDALKAKLQADFGGVFDPKGAGAKAAEDALAAFQRKSFTIQCTIPGVN